MTARDVEQLTLRHGVTERQAYLAVVTDAMLQAPAYSPELVLSEREFSVFIQLAQGRSVAQIAEALNLSGSTVGTHHYHVKQKLRAGNQSELTLVALRWGLIQA